MAFRTLSRFPTFDDSVFTDRFNRIDQLFSQLTGNIPVQASPAYDIRRLDEQNYQLIISVPGWQEDELEIETVGGQLTVSGKREEKNQDEEQGWIHRGIRRADFRMSYALPEQMKVRGARMELGLLKVDLYQEIPEHEKPKKIAIENGTRVIEHQA
ncbi:Hsp20 family protein [[Erwinia] mediterraneensis]|uniref:Hsp20 family protein n=1 Tax=[Erwinia] mediterraneensis TaxID=2161819 RepID=UPI00102FD042|nr:Hsp20 family protein [[Erwinia] mediterraneensis]